MQDSHIVFQKDSLTPAKAERPAGYEDPHSNLKGFDD
jgi:hypothetical protein